ncbi:unnamed protein product [Malus baccata var. baccata]
MVHNHKACGVYMIPFFLLLLFSSKLVFANVSEHPVHRKLMISRSHLQMEIILAKKVQSIDVPIGSKPPGIGREAP